MASTMTAFETDPAKVEKSDSKDDSFEDHKD